MTMSDIDTELVRSNPVGRMEEAKGEWVMTHQVTSRIGDDEADRQVRSGALTGRPDRPMSVTGAQAAAVGTRSWVGSDETLREARP